MFFIIILVFIGPALSAISFNSELNAAAAADPEWATTIDYEDSVMGVWFVWSICTSLTLLTALLLIFRRKPSTVVIAILILWVVGPGISALLLIDLASVGESITADLWVDLARSIVPAAIWSAYLLKSERVSNTYNFRRPSGPVEADIPSIS